MVVVKRYKHAFGRGRPGNDGRSHLPAPMVIPDGMDDTRNHADGQMYDSRSSYMRAVKDAGCQVIGDDIHPDDISISRPEPDFGDVGQDIKDAMDQVEAKTNTGEIPTVE